MSTTNTEDAMRWGPPNDNSVFNAYKQLITNLEQNGGITGEIQLYDGHYEVKIMVNRHL